MASIEDYDEDIVRKRTHSLDTGLDTDITDPVVLASPVTSRPRLNINKETRSDVKSPKSKSKKIERWIPNQMHEDYVNLVGDIMYPKSTFHYADANPAEGKYPLDKINTLGYLVNPLRKRSVLEKWNPYEVSVFEASITLYGKNFNRIHKAIQSKTCKEVIEFYYAWKKTDHYQQWKLQYKNYVAEEIVVPAGEATP
mmetsp:Transcript_6440/g.10540  ORF Transcript_6440/g.10540 Transcript_6440/m.10540 type:complete len:197 (-) Transcript_6440:115-705(-)